MRTRKKVLALLLSIVAIVTIISMPTATFASNAQENQVTMVQKTKLPYYHQQGVWERNPDYVPLTRQFIEWRVCFVAYDAEGYAIPFADLEINQAEVDAINDVILQDLQWFTDEGLVNDPNGKTFPITLTAPDGRSWIFQINIIYGGNSVYSYFKTDVKAKDVTYDIQDGPVTWDELMALSEINVYDGNDGSVIPSLRDFEACVRELKDINDAILAAEKGTYPMHGTIWAYYMGGFNVTLIDSNDCTVKYHQNDGTGFVHTVETSLSLNPHIALETPINEYVNHEFVAWNTGADGNGNTYTSLEKIELEGDLQLYAQWQKVKRSLTYNANGATEGTPPSDTTVYRHDDKVTVLDQGTLGYEGYTFQGWNTAADGSGTAYKAGDTFTITDDVVLYGQWKKADDIPETGDQPAVGVMLALLGSLLLITVLVKKRKLNLN